MKTSDDPGGLAVKYMAEQAELIATYLRSGGCDKEFLTLHIIALWQGLTSSPLDPDPEEDTLHLPYSP